MISEAIEAFSIADVDVTVRSPEFIVFRHLQM